MSAKETICTKTLTQCDPNSVTEESKHTISVREAFLYAREIMKADKLKRVQQRQDLPEIGKRKI